MENNQSVFGISPWFEQPSVVNEHERRNLARPLFTFFLSIFVWIPVGLCSAVGGCLIFWIMTIGLLAAPLDLDLKTVAAICSLFILPMTLMTTAFTYQCFAVVLRSALRSVRIVHSRLIVRVHAYVLGPLPSIYSIISYRTISTSVIVLCVALAGAHIRARFEAIVSYGENGINDPEFFLMLWDGYWSIVVCEWFLLLATLLVADALALAQALALFKTSSVENLPQPKEACCAILIAHVSDLHLTRSNTSPLFGELGPFRKGKPAGTNDAAKAFCTSGAALLAASQSIVISGDVVDTGHPDEWKHFFDLPLPFNRCVLVPGNHDINIAHETTSAHETPYMLIDTDDFHYRQLRLIRWLIACDRIQGDRAFVLSEPDRILVPFRKMLEPYIRRLEMYAANPPSQQWRTMWHRRCNVSGAITHSESCPADLMQIQLPDEVWRQTFPLVVDCGKSVPAVVVLDSNMKSSNVLSNAFGQFGEKQLARLHSTLLLLGCSPYCIAAHHHPGVPHWVRRKAENWQSRALSCLDTSSFIDVLRRHRRTIVFCGHRHACYTGYVSSSRPEDAIVEVCSAPAATLPDDCSGKAFGGFTVYETVADSSGVHLNSWYTHEHEHHE